MSKPPTEAQDWVNEKRRQIRDKANEILGAGGRPRFRAVATRARSPGSQSSTGTSGSRSSTASKGENLLGPVT